MVNIYAIGAMAVSLGFAYLAGRFHGSDIANKKWHVRVVAAEQKADQIEAESRRNIAALKASHEAELEKVRQADARAADELSNKQNQIMRLRRRLNVELNNAAEVDQCISTQLPYDIRVRIEERRTGIDHRGTTGPSLAAAGTG